MADFLGPVVLALLRLVQALPLGVQAVLGRALGRLLWWLAAGRRGVALRNLELCFPEMDAGARRRLAREHFGWLGRSLLERGLLWFAPPERLKKLIHVDGEPTLTERSERPVMWLVLHFVGLEVGGAAAQLFQTRTGVDIYQPQSSAFWDQAFLRGRLRFGRGEAFPRNASVRPVIKRIREGAPFFNSPDMDFGRRDAVFLPFFGVPASTLLAPSRMARALDMVVQPLIVEMLPGGQGWKVRFDPPWADWPTDDPVADTERLNRWIEAEVRRNPAQYLWVHKRFKTRPPGEPSLYR